MVKRPTDGNWPDWFQVLLRVIGYGNPTGASVCFLCLEERADAKTWWKNVSTRRDQQAPVSDMFVLHQHLEKAGISSPYNGRLVKVPVWVQQARLVAALAGLDWSDRLLVDRLIRNTLGRDEGDVFLMEAGVVPRPGVKWPVPGLPGYHPFDIFRQRVPVLKAALNRMPLRFLVVSGKGAWPCIEALVNLCPSEFRGQQAVWHQVPAVSPMEIAQTTSGLVVARVGFLGWAPGSLKRDDVPILATAMRELSGGGPLRLNGRW